MTSFDGYLEKELCNLVATHFARGWLNEDERKRAMDLQKLLRRTVIRFVPAHELLPAEAMRFEEVGS